MTASTVLAQCHMGNKTAISDGSTEGKEQYDRPQQSQFQHQLPCLPSDQTILAALAVQHPLPMLVDEQEQLVGPLLEHAMVVVVPDGLNQNP